ncbi:zinc finger protein 771-like [Culex pipiens pallens]|uniref:zinc finger protein 771-like n=1 Tax=Culex pipiens pallens TaxID=42434 RepID=UPI001954DB34|nr:zinc finger protein 771-like [Culex pipiens pallens]
MSLDESTKRVYKKRSPLCRLCLQEYPKKLMNEIFGKEAGCKKDIQAAVGLKLHRSDQTIRICNNCKEMVNVIVTFQRICQQNEQTLLQGSSEVSWTCWKESIEQINSVRGLLDQFQGSSPVIGAVKKEELEMFADCGMVESKVEDEEIDLMQLEIEPLITKVEVDPDNCDGYVEEEANEVEFDNEDDDEDFRPDGPDSESEPEPQAEERKVKKQKAKERYRQTHKAKSGKVVCSTCGEMVSQQGLEGHMNRHLGVAPYSCEVEGCESKLYSKYALQMHRHHHKVVNQYYDCPHCGKKLKGYSNWLRHKSSHTQPPKYSCEICGKQFRRGSHYKIHETVHTGVAKYPCEVCGKRFTVKHNLAAHYKIHMREGTYPMKRE